MNMIIYVWFNNLNAEQCHLHQLAVFIHPANLNSDIITRPIWIQAGFCPVWNENLNEERVMTRREADDWDVFDIHTCSWRWMCLLITQQPRFFPGIARHCWAAAT